MLSLLEWFSPPGMPSLRVYITLEVYVTMRSCLLVLSHQLCHVTKNYSCWVRFVSVGVLSLENSSLLGNFLEENSILQGISLEENSTNPHS